MRVGTYFYSAVSEANEKGYVTADVTLENDEIVEVELTEFNNMARKKR
ncbi:hypothetical protein [Natranaerobius trueperi]|nr:hypothetical protein [Natranaerobius trueperi]